jgi:LysM repeat protein
MDAQGAISATNTSQEYWYRYDSMNRFITTKGMLAAKNASGVVVIGDSARGLDGAFIERAMSSGLSNIHDDGLDLYYDAAGRRIRTVSSKFKKDTIELGSGASARYSTTFTQENYVENYVFSRDGYLQSTSSGSSFNINFKIYNGGSIGSGYKRDIAYPNSYATQATYARDAMGRVTDYREYIAEGYNGTDINVNLAYAKATQYNSKGQVTNDVMTSVRSDGVYVNSTIYYYNAAETSSGSGEWSGVRTGGIYLGGSVTKTVTAVTKDGVAQTGNSTTYNYKFWDGAIQSKTNYVSGGDNWTSTFYYDTSGRLTSVYAQDGRPRTISFVNDANGQILQRAEADNRYPSNPRDPDSADYKTTGDPHELHFYFNGLRVGDISNNGTSDVDYATSIASHIATGGTGAFRGGSSSSTSYADFDQSYDPINGLTYESTSSRYTVQSGDTLEAIAQQVWGDVSFWYMIADANGLSASDSLVAGQSLIIPNKVHNAHNNTSTYKVYDPNEAIGDTSPTAARPPKKNGCGVLGAILVVVVAIAVSYFAGPEIIHAAQAVLGGIASSGAVAAGSFGAVAGGIVGGAATGALASVVSQGVGLAVGAQDSFSWKGVALSALGAGISGGLGATGLFGSIAKNGFEVGKLGIKSAFADAMVRSALGSAATQGIGVATHLQDDFDWAGVAGAALGAGLSSQVNVGGFGGNVLRSTAGGLANAASRSVINGTDFGDNIVAALPDMIANTIGNLVADAVAGDGKPRSSSREGSSSGGVTALQDVGPVQVGPIDMSALDDLNFQLVLSGDGGSAIAGGNPLSGPGPGMPDGSGEVGAPIVINADRHQRDMLGALNGTQYRYYESLAGSTNYNELAAWEARSYAPPQAYVRSNFFYDSPLTQSFQTWQRMPWENFSYNGRDYVSMAAAEAGGMPVIRSGPSAYDVYQSQRDKAFIDSIGEGGLGLGPIVYAVGGDPDTIRLSNQLDVAIGGLAVGGALRPGSSVRFSASGRPSVSVLLPVAESEVLNGANFAQKTFKSTFSAEGKFAGRPVSDVAADLNAGRLSPADVPIEYIVRDGNTLILNTRSAQALEQAGIPRGQWNAVNMTGNAQVEARLTGQLSRNRLTSQGTATVRPSNGN